MALNDFQKRQSLEPMDDEIGIGQKIMPKANVFSFKTVFVLVLIVVLVIGSFWISFLLGRQILSPLRKLPEIDYSAVQKSLDEPKPAVPQVQEQPAVVEEELSEEPAAVVVPEVKKTVPAKKPAAPAVKPAPAEDMDDDIPESPIPETAVAPASSGLYRVQVTTTKTKDDALAIMKDLKAGGFETFARDLGAGKGFSVQVGVFKSKKNADILIEQLKSKGFSGSISEE